jgi:hypothetical protein
MTGSFSHEEMQGYDEVAAKGSIREYWGFGKGGVEESPLAG